MNGPGILLMDNKQTNNYSYAGGIGTCTFERGLYGLIIMIIITKTLFNDDVYLKNKKKNTYTLQHNITK